MIESGITVYDTESPITLVYLGYSLTSPYRLGSALLINFSLEKAYRLSETSINVNLGIQWDVYNGVYSKLQLYTNSFYRSATKLIRERPERADVFRYVNVEKVRMKGSRCKCKLLFQKWIALTQSVSYLEPLVLSDEDELGNENIIEGPRLSNTPFFSK